MTLIITAIAAIVVAIAYFVKPAFAQKNSLGVLALAYVGASLMWVVDGIACVLEGEPFVELTDTAVMADDALLGVCVVVLGIVVWAIARVYNNSKKSAKAAA
jgi:hypothetical protein